MFNELIPNVIELTPDLIKALKETLIMVGSAGLYGTLIGLPLGVIMLVTGKNHILENKYLYSILSKLINTIRSIPFVILIAAIPGLIRAISGTTIGVKGAIVPLTIVCIPTMARQIELALIKVDKGIIEAYQGNFERRTRWNNSSHHFMFGIAFRLFSYSGNCRRRRSWRFCYKIRLSDVQDRCDDSNNSNFINLCIYSTRNWRQPI